MKIVIIMMNDEDPKALTLPGGECPTNSKLVVYEEVLPSTAENQSICLGQSTCTSNTDRPTHGIHDTYEYYDPLLITSAEMKERASGQEQINYSCDACYNFSNESLMSSPLHSTIESPFKFIKSPNSEISGYNGESQEYTSTLPEPDMTHISSWWSRGNHTPPSTSANNDSPLRSCAPLEMGSSERANVATAWEKITASPIYTGQGMAAYFEDEDDPKPPTASPASVVTQPRNKCRKRKPPEPWYRVSRPIHEQTKDLKIRSVNRSTSIYFSRLLEKCRSIVEYCMRQDNMEEITDTNIAMMNHNHQWGDSMPTNVKGKTIRVVYQNVHRSISASDNPHTNVLLDNLNNMEVDIFLASETNVNWKSAKHRNDFRHKVSRVWPSNRIAFSSSDVGIQFESHEFLPGGTCTMAVDNLSMRVVKVGEDPSGLGRWSYITLEGQGGRKLTCITAYRICKGAMKGVSTSCRQQLKVINDQEMKNGLKASNIDTSYLRRKFVDDLILFIQSLQEEGHAIVLGMDANETPEESIDNKGETKPGSVSWLLEQTNMNEVFASGHGIQPDSTTTTPGRFIDRLAVSGIDIERVALLRANEPAKSDHLGIMIDLDLHFLFDNACSPLASPQPRKLTSGNAEAVKKYVTFIQKQFVEHRIVERCRRLREISETETFDDYHRSQLYSLDKQVTEILLGAENHCSKKRVKRNLWSPALAKAGKEIGYWKQRIAFNGRIDDGTRELGVSLDLPATVQQPMSVELCQFYLGVAWKSYRGIQAQERAYRDKFLKAKAKELAEKGNGDAAQAVRQIRHREKLRGDYASIRRGYGVQKQGLSTLDVPDDATGGRKLLTEADEIHAYLLRRNAKHFSQATFTTFGNAGPGFKYIDPEDPESDANIDAMLEGTFEPWDSASPNVREFLQELKSTIVNELNTKLCLADFKQLFRTIPENTASSVSGLHYGHYKVLSKLGDDTIIGVLFDLVNIAFITHSPLPRWRHATQLMLEKGKGPSVENLRIIQLLEADMNWLLRFLWGRKLEKHATVAGIYNEAQFASPGKLCQSAILNKVLFFDLLRQTRQYGALMDNDATAAFDRVLPALCVVTCRQLGMPREAQRFFYKLLRQMVYTTTTAHGRSTATYSATENPDVPGQGVIQGGGASLPNYKSQQLPVINAYEHNCTPAVFRPASKLRPAFRRWISGFSDDIGLFLSELGVRMSGSDAHLPIAQRVRNALHRNLLKYEEYFFTAGGALNVKKCFYYLVGFHWTGTNWRYCTNAEIDVDPIVITPTTLDESGVPQQVQWHEADDAQRTLGSFIAPDGSCRRQLDVLQGKLMEWKQCLRNLSPANLQARWLAYQNVFMRKVMYPLIRHSCTASDLHFLQKPVDRELLHILGLNEHFPRAALYAPLKYGGMGCVTIHGQHVIDKVLLFVHHMREGGKIRETLMGSMSITQLECGTSRPFFDLQVDPWYNLVTQTWVTHIWRECQPLGIALKFYHGEFWTPAPVREGDECIMDIASTLYSGEQLRQINLCRIALKVTYLSDITSVDGKRILLAYYNGQHHQASGRRTRLNWPPVGNLPTSWWTLWKNFLTRWCGSALRLPKPLGRWYADAAMLTQCCFFMHDRCLIMQHDDTFYTFSPTSSRARTRFCTQAQLMEDTSILCDAKVVDVVYKHQCIYVVAQSDQLVIPSPRTPRVRSLQDLYANLPPELQRTIGNVIWPEVPELIDIVQSLQEGTAIGVSDGSVRIKDAKATHAWILQAQNGSEIRGHGPVDGEIEARTIHRAELQGQTALFLVLALIVRYAGIIGGTLATYCDNQAVVRKLQNGWRLWRYRHTKGADSDIQAQLRDVLHDLERSTSIFSTTHWVKGHQDDTMDISSLPRQVHLNVQMDDDTKAAYALPAQWQTQRFIPVLRAEGCAIYFGDRKITSNLHLSLKERWHEEEAKSYLRQRHNLTTDMLEAVNWQSLQYALEQFRTHRRALAIKMIHRHLPTHDKLFKQGRVVMSSLCPRCVHRVETNLHVVNCPNDDAVKHRKAAWLDMWKSLHKQRTATIIERTWRFYLQPLLGLPLGTSMVDSLPTASGELAGLLQLAVDEQAQLGWEKLLMGLGTSAWKTLQDFIDTNNPTPPQRTATVWMNVAMHQFLKFSLRCWKQRNLMVHGSTRQEQRQIALQNVREQIKSVYAQPPVLAPGFQPVHAVPLEHRLKMPLQSAEQWLAMIAHQVKVTAHNFQLLLNQHQTIPSHLRTMRREARNQAKERTQPATPRKAHRRAVQAANIAMREKLYSKRSDSNNPRLRAILKQNQGVSRRRTERPAQSFLQRIAVPGGDPVLRLHPP